MSLMKKSLTTFLFAGMSLLASAGSTNLGQELKQREVLFDGKSLVNWDYDKNFWGLQADGTLKGESTKENRTRSSTFIISKDHSYADFEIELDYKIPTHNNSGVIYRCSEIGEKGSYRVSGYQAEGENKLSKGGFMFDESRRGWLASPGELVVIQERGAKKIIGAVNRPIDLSEQKFVNYREWNHYRIVARGNHFMHYINGHLSIELIDRDTRLKDSSRRGAIALQLHGGSPMTVFFRDIIINRFKSEFGKTQILLGATLEGWKVSASSKIEIPYVPAVIKGLVNQRGGKDGAFPAPQLNLQGTVSRLLPAGDGILRFHQKAGLILKLGKKSIKLAPAAKAQIDGYNAVEVLVRGNYYEVTAAAKVIASGKLSGRQLTFKSKQALVRNVLWLPLLKNK